MKKRIAVSVMVSALLFLSVSMPVCARAERNTTFTTTQQMQEMMGSDDPDDWSTLYLTEVEQYYWNFSPSGQQDNRRLTLDIVSNAYQNLEMFLDNGYLLDYNELREYAEDYLVRRGMEDAYYKILTDCLNNPYLLNRPEAEVTDYTYNGRDYSKVFDPDYYYDNNEDLQVSIGFNPPELLRHFVEKGITEGRRGSAELDMDIFIAYTDGQIAYEHTGAPVPGLVPVVSKYSYSRANYYGKYLGHYDYSGLYETVEVVPEDMGIPAIPEDEEENTTDW